LIGYPRRVAGQWQPVGAMVHPAIAEGILL
jgi:hypothetical protein